MAVLASVLFGCGPSADSMIAALNDSNIKRLSNLYVTFQYKHDYKGPKDEAEFRSFIAGENAGQLKRIGVDATKLDDLFISERDKQKFNIRWAVKTELRAPSVPIVFEAQGVNGLRQVGFTGGELQEVESDRYTRLWDGEESVSVEERPDGVQKRKR